MMVLHYVAQTLKLVLPLMEHPSETFLAGLEEDLIKLIMKHGQMVSWEEGLTVATREHGHTCNVHTYLC